MSESIKPKFFQVQNLQLMNYWILATWFTLRVVDYIFTALAISSGLGVEINPIGFNILLFLIGFGLITALTIINYKCHKRKDIIFPIFFASLLMASIQSIVTFIGIVNFIFILRLLN